MVLPVDLQLKKSFLDLIFAECCCHPPFSVNVNPLLEKGSLLKFQCSFHIADFSTNFRIIIKQPMMRYVTRLVA